MNLKLAAFLISILVLLAGCNTLSVRAIKDPDSKLTRESKIYLNPFRDTNIQDRRQMALIIEVAKSLGLNIVEKDKADFILYANYREGMRYNSTRQTFERKMYARVRDTEVELRNYKYIDYGMINIGIFAMKSEDSRSEWEGCIEINNFSDDEELKNSFSLILQKLGEDFIGEVKTQSSEKKEK